MRTRTGAVFIAYRGSFGREGRDMEKKEMEKENADPRGEREKGERVTVIRHFCGERELADIMAELAKAQASREAGR